MNAVKELTMTGNRSELPFTFKEWLVTNKASEINLNDVLRNGDFVIETVGDYHNQETWVDQQVTAQLISGKLLQFIQNNAQNITEEMLDNAEVVLNSYGIDFENIRNTYDGMIDGMIDEVLNNSRYILPIAINQVEFNRILVSKLSAIVSNPNFSITKTMVKNILEFSYQLDDISACAIIRGVGKRELIKNMILDSGKFIEWCKIYKTIVLNDELPFRANERFTGRKENAEAMELYES